jgi:hypothetical protein
MIPDGEILSLLCTILTKLDVGEFMIKVHCFYLRAELAAHHAFNLIR